MSRKVSVGLKVKIIVNMDDGIDVHDVVSDLDFNFLSTTPFADVEDSTIMDYEVLDSK